MKYGTFEADGRKFAIEITDSGTFRTVIDGDPYSADTYEKLKAKIVRACRKEKVRLALPATLAHGVRRFNDDDHDAVFDITITGIHQRSKDVLYRKDADHKAGTADYNDKILVRLTREQKDKYLELRIAVREAKKAFEAFQNKHAYSVDDIKKQVAAAEKAAGVEPEEDR